MKKYITTLLIMLAAVVLIIIGVTQKQFNDVLAKSINICLECVGIG